MSVLGGGGGVTCFLVKVEMLRSCHLGCDLALFVPQSKNTMNSHRFVSILVRTFHSFTVDSTAEL